MNPLHVTRASDDPASRHFAVWRRRGRVLLAFGFIAVAVAAWNLLENSGWKFVSTREPDVAPRPPSEREDLPQFGDHMSVDELPEAETKVAPIYPGPARASGVEGTVLVQALVGQDGRVREVRAVRSIPMLDDAALTAVRQWRFKPAKARGEPVALWVAVPVRFTLR